MPLQRPQSAHVCRGENTTAVDGKARRRRDVRIEGARLLRLRARARARVRARVRVRVRVRAWARARARARIRG